jgi:3-methyladenine DNA glycosylase AlkD
MKPPSLLAELRAEFSRVARPDDAPIMQAYMKSKLPYHGVKMPEVRRICRRLFAGVEFAGAADWQRQVRAIWNGARYREERYAAIALTGHRAARPFQTPAALPLYEELIVSGAWWDFVDDLADHRVGPLVRDFPSELKPVMRAWSRSGDLWKRRTSIICQMHFKHQTDLKLLYACIEPSLDSKEFFLRKAIGWALRQYAWLDAREVVRYVRAHRTRLSPLSKREALKNVVKQGVIDAIP